MQNMDGTGIHTPGGDGQGAVSRFVVRSVGARQVSTGALPREEDESTDVGLNALVPGTRETGERGPLPTSLSLVVRRPPTGHTGTNRTVREDDERFVRDEGTHHCRSSSSRIDYLWSRPS